MNLIKYLQNAKEYCNKRYDEYIYIKEHCNCNCKYSHLCTLFESIPADYEIKQIELLQIEFDNNTKENYAN